MTVQFGTVSLRPMTGSDLERVRAWRNSESVRQFMTSDAIITAEGHRSWWERTEGREDCRYLIACEAGEPQGLVYFNGIDPARASASMGIYIGAEKRRRGLGSIMQWLLIEQAFGPMGLGTLHCEVLSNNPRALALYERFGFEPAGRDAGVVRRPSGEVLDMMRLVLTAEAWQGRRGKQEQDLQRYL